MWLAHVRDTMRWLLIQNAPESVADFPLLFKLRTTRDFGNKRGWPHGYRSLDMGCCAYASRTDNDETLIELQLPIPDYCPYELYKSVILLINHEIHHIILEDFLEGDEGEEASNLWDHPKTVRKLNKILPFVFCDCDAKLNPAEE